MNRNIIFSLIMVLLFSASCKKETFERFDKPDWKVENIGQYFATMSAVVQLPTNILSDAGMEDRIGAFINDECRSLGTIVITDSTSVYFLLIHGTPDEQSQISIKYYSHKNGRMYLAEKATRFAVDANFGSIDAPEILNLKPL